MPQFRGDGQHVLGRLRAGYPPARLDRPRGKSGQRGGKGRSVLAARGQLAIPAPGQGKGVLNAVRSFRRATQVSEGDLGAAAEAGEEDQEAGLDGVGGGGGGEDQRGRSRQQPPSRPPRPGRPDAWGKGPPPATCWAAGRAAGEGYRQVKPG
jgi:hypothetical protein